jgi:hypothetical protein
MIDFPHALHQHIIHVDLHVSAYLLPEHLVDQSLVGSPSILQLERHHLVAVQPPVNDEGRLLLIHLV